MASCVDTVILPYDKIVDEDFWQSKSDVAAMVNGAYASAIAEDYTKRRIVWSGLRSDELRYDPSIVYNKDGDSSTELLQIETGNIETTNSYANWASVYSTINNCNIVLEKAGAVVSIDPSYTEGDYLADRSQMLALRALCYFDLVRAFRDVPYSATAIMTSSQITDIPQSDPAYILQRCIEDLEEARKNALVPDGYEVDDWKRTGWINREGIDAILADIYLWRASVLHSADDYQKCIEYCDKVIESKKSYYSSMGAGNGATEAVEYPLAEGDDSFNDIFVKQNAEESILELQYNGSNNSNSGVAKYYFKYNKDGGSGFLKASLMFGTYGTSNVYFQKGDFRYLQNCYGVGGTAEMFDVRKMTEYTEYYLSNPNGAAAYDRASNGRAFASYKQNLILYRLSDVMLMKAEALVQIAADDNADELTEAFNIVEAVNSRSISKDMISNDRLKINNYKGKTAMEELVLAERLRELCFECKRWYDLMRYNYRHVEGVDYSTTLVAQEEAGAAFVANYEPMLDLMTRKLGSGGPALAAKTKTEPTLYMPIIQSQIDISPVLKQNPSYHESSDFEQN